MGAQAIRTGEQPCLNVYRSVAMPVVGILGWKSYLENVKPFAVPDFTSEETRQPYADDRWSPLAENAGPGQPCPSIRGDIRPTPEAIAYARKFWKEQLGYYEEEVCLVLMGIMGQHAALVVCLLVSVVVLSVCGVATAADSLGTVAQSHPRLVFTPELEPATVEGYRSHPLYGVIQSRVLSAWATDPLSVAGSRQLRDIAFAYRVSGEQWLAERGTGAIERAARRLLKGDIRTTPSSSPT